jgi:hypothetical protein
VTERSFASYFVRDANIEGDLPNVSSNDWLTLSGPELAKIVNKANLAVMVPSDGSRRHYLLNVRRPDEVSASHYLASMGRALAQLIGRLFLHGVKTVVISMLEGPNFERSTDYVERGIAGAHAIITGETFAALYREHGVRARLCGAYDLFCEPRVRNALQETDRTLGAMTPTGSRLLLYGFFPRRPVDEVIERSARLSLQLGRAPSHAEVHAACYPHGPGRLDALINSDWMRAGRLVPPILDEGTHYYHLNFSPYALTDEDVRAILYDLLFVRRPEPPEGVNYSPETLEAFREYAAQHGRKIIGLGRRVGPGIWQP